MNGGMILDAIGMINDAAVRDAREYRRRPRGRRAAAVAAAAVLCFLISVPALAAANPAVYSALYALSPAAAQYFKPVQLYCEDNGIRVEVISANIHGDTAEIYVSLRDLEGTRVDKSTDLFDSCRINTPFDCTGSCRMSGWDEKTRTATFLITIENWGGRRIEGEKLTFSLKNFLSGKTEYEGFIDGVDLVAAETQPPVQIVWPRGVSGAGLAERYREPEGLTALRPVLSAPTPAGGVTVTGIGYIGDELHIQVHYEDIMKTDSHGWVSLVDRDSGEEINCDGSFSFFDAQGTGSYEDYIFKGIPQSELGNYLLRGCFVSSGNYTEGDWSVTFPLMSGSF